MKTLFVAIFILFFVPVLGWSQKKNISPAQRPNIILILADDMGYSDLGCFGSSIQTPVLDAMAKEGLKMTNFYNASRCCPTRASLLTGLYQHQAGVGDMMNTRPQPAYQGYLNKNCVTIAEVLKTGGYATYMAGKWHLGQAEEHWPKQRGFDRYYGLIDGANSYFENIPYRPNQKLTIALDNQPIQQLPPNYYSTNAYTDYALKFIKEQQDSQQPFFLYLAYQAPHWPLHALPQDIQKYRGSFLKGWDVLRAERFKKQKALGLIPKNLKLSPRDENVPAWESLSKEQQEDWDEKMSVYAAMIDRMDQNIGKLKQQLKEMGKLDNTVFIFLSDNGASSESIGGSGFSKEVNQAALMQSSNPNSFTSYSYEGANVSNTPFKLFKHWEYEGGTATPFIAYGPNFIKTQQVEKPAHIVDLMQTCLDLAHIIYPINYKQNSILPTEGVSLLPLFKGEKWKGHETLFFEHEGNRAVIKGKWKIVSEYPTNKWELYNLKSDRSELNNLASKKAEIVKELESEYFVWAKHAGVIPFEQLDKKKRQEDKY